MAKQTHTLDENIPKIEGEKKKNPIIVLEEDGETVIINGKKNNLYKIPLDGIAIIVENVNIKWVEKFKELKQAFDEGKMSRKFAFVGIASAILSFLATGNIQLLFAATGMAFSLGALINKLISVAKTNKISKEIRKYDDINDCCAIAYMSRVIKGEDLGNSVEILADSARMKKDAVEEITGKDITQEV